MQGKKIITPPLAHFTNLNNIGINFLEFFLI